MSKKVIFLDIDGTLAEPGHGEPPASAIEAVRKAQAAGNLVFLCSGRNYGMLSSFLEYGFDGVVASAGGYILCGENVIYDCPMTDAQRIKTMDTLTESGLCWIAECRDEAYASDSFKAFVEKDVDEQVSSEFLRWREFVKKTFSIRSIEEYRNQPVYKFVATSPSMKRLDAPRKALEEEFLFCIQDVSHGVVNLELINRKFNKGTAVRKVCEYLQIPVSDSVGFGDSMNDKEMLETAGLSICMENGSEAVKRIADEVCPKVTEDGIWKAFQKHHLM